jgi:hypothetical protein
MSIKSDQISFTSRVLGSVVLDNNTRLQNGLRMREQIHDQLEAGTEPDHYRVDWIRQTVLKLFDVLEEQAREFNEEHPNDLISSKDLGDALVSAVRTLSKI